MAISIDTLGGAKVLSCLTSRQRSLEFVSATRTYSSSSSSSSDVATSANKVPAKSRDGVVGHPIDFDIASKVEGNESQIVTIELEPGQVLRAESGAMMYMYVP